MNLCFPVEKNDGLQSKVSGHFGSAPLLLLVDTETEQCVALKREHPGRNRLAGLLAGQTLDGAVVASIGQGAYSQLQATGAKIYKVAAAKIVDNLTKLKADELSELNMETLCVEQVRPRKLGRQNRSAEPGRGRGRGQGNGRGAGRGFGRN